MTTADLDALLTSRDAASLEAALATATTGSPEALALEGELLRRLGEPAQARPLLARALALRPDCRALYHACALAHAAIGDTASARERWQALLASFPDDTTARFQIAVTCHDERRLDDAAHWYEAQAAAVPGMFAAWWNLGLVQEARGAVDAALAAYERAADVAPQDPRPLARAAALLGRTAALPEAIGRLDRAIALAPDDATLRFARAAHRSSLALHAEAVDDLRAATSLAPHDAAGGSALLVELHYDERLATPDRAGGRHSGMGRASRDCAGKADHSAAPSPALRIGYLSPRFGDVPPVALLAPVLAAHDRTRFESSPTACCAGRRRRGRAKPGRSLGGPPRRRRRGGRRRSRGMTSTCSSTSPGTHRATACRCSRVAPRACRPPGSTGSTPPAPAPSIG